MVIGVLVREWDVLKACAGEGWKRKRMGCRILPPGGGRDVDEVSGRRKKTGEGGRSDAGSVLDGSGGRDKFGRGRFILRSSSTAYLEVEGVAEKRGTWKEVRREEIAAMRSE